MSMQSAIEFECPTCGAKHTRGYLNGVDTFRCMACGYVGHGWHPDPETDREVQADVMAAAEIDAKVFADAGTEGTTK